MASKAAAQKYMNTFKDETAAHIIYSKLLEHDVSVVNGYSGGAILPLAYGGLADVLSSQLAYAIMIPCYLFIGYYATLGHKKASW